jgi:hypothetical protein
VVTRIFCKATVHVWQQTFGKPPRGSSYERQWATKIKEIGLQSSTTGAPGGEETGTMRGKPE